jgi:hypothetical protein
MSAADDFAAAVRPGPGLRVVPPYLGFRSHRGLCQPAVAAGPLTTLLPRAQVEILPGRLFFVALRRLENLKTSTVAATNVCFTIDDELVRFQSALASFTSTPFTLKAHSHTPTACCRPP